MKTFVVVAVLALMAVSLSEAVNCNYNWEIMKNHREVSLGPKSYPDCKMSCDNNFQCR